MSDVKWTEGPWTAFETGEHAYINAANAGFITTVTIRPGRADECRANANLIAAAPELYEALVEAANEYSDRRGDFPSKWKAALLKSRGEHHG